MLIHIKCYKNTNFFLLKFKAEFKNYYFGAGSEIFDKLEPHKNGPALQHCQKLGTPVTDKKKIPQITGTKKSSVSLHLF
jgi:hypothetical protein